MSLGPAALADRLETAARQLSRQDARLAQACAEAAAFFREEFDVEPGASGEDLTRSTGDNVVPVGARRR
jgi:hypothetical protein